MELVIVTGISGAGKSEAVASLEDISFYCVDNIPPELIKPFVDICRQTKIKKIALVADIRGSILFHSIIDQIKHINPLSIKYKILFLDAQDDIIIFRYKKTRRKHPLVGDQFKTISDSITAERKLLDPIKKIADIIIDTSQLKINELKNKIKDLFSTNTNDKILLNLNSFGFKYGLPIDSDLVFDVRFLPNPFYIENLKFKTGLQSCVRDYVLQFQEAILFKDKLFDFLDFLIPLYQKEGKSQLVISIGCTGGKHRSVTFVELVSQKLNEHHIKCLVNHRDIDK